MQCKFVEIWCHIQTLCSFLVNCLLGIDKVAIIINIESDNFLGKDIWVRRT